jgi:LacI family transcriptional regulator
MKKVLSIGDIARELNISITSVSFILNGKAEEKRISPELTKRVLKLVNDVGYVPNQLAKSLRTGKTNIIGLIVEDISNPFFANVARLIEENANKRGYKIFYCSSENNTIKTQELIKVFRERQVDGYIITPAAGIEKDIVSLLNNKAKVVLFDRYLPSINTSYVIVDNMGGSYKAMTHLVQQGFKNIGIVTLKSDQTQMQKRLEGYTLALEEHGLKPCIKKIKFHDSTEHIIDEIMEFISKNIKLDAIFFATNYLGVAGLEAIKRLNISIPSDLAVLSFDDHDLFRLYSPSISVLAQPIEEMSENLINILLEHLDEEKESVKQIMLSPKLILRESTKR